LIFIENMSTIEEVIPSLQIYNDEPYTLNLEQAKLNTINTLNQMSNKRHVCGIHFLNKVIKKNLMPLSLFVAF